MSLQLLFLTQDEVRKCGGDDISLAINTMKKVFSLHQNEEYILPNKSVLRWGDTNSEISQGRINSLSAYIGGEFRATGVKWISNVPKNPYKFSMPRASGLIILNDFDTLSPIAVMDGALISATRTGANSGVAADYLAKRESKKLGLIGAGVQNKAQLLAMSKVLKNLEYIKVMDINLKKAKEFANEMASKVGINIKVVESPKEAIENSDVFITATETKKPVVKYDWIKPGALYIHIGNHESEFEVINKADKIVVDDWGKIKQRGVSSIALMHANGRINNSDIHAQLGEIVNKKKIGRSYDEEFIYFNCVGMGIQDIAFASIIYHSAKEKKVGKVLVL